MVMVSNQRITSSMSPDETSLFTALRHASVPTEGWCSTTDVLATAASLGMRTVRLDALLSEWTRAGWWVDGSGSFSGYFTDKAPALRDVMQRVAA
jgi:hypothetical protein